MFFEKRKLKKQRNLKKFDCIIPESVQPTHEEIEAYEELSPVLNREAQAIERGSHGGGCPYPIKL
jgi:hypothetical protein